MGRAAKSNVAFQAQPTTPETATHEGLRLLACLIAEAWRQHGGEVPVADPATPTAAQSTNRPAIRCFLQPESPRAWASGPTSAEEAAKAA